MADLAKLAHKKVGKKKGERLKSYGATRIHVKVRVVERLNKNYFK